MPEEEQPKRWKFAFIGGTEVNTDVSPSESGGEAGFPLDIAQVGDRVWITELTIREDLAPLLRLGLHPGNELEIVSYTSGGAIVVKWEDNTLALSGDIAKNIRVTKDPNLIREIDIRSQLS